MNKFIKKIISAVTICTLLNATLSVSAEGKTPYCNPAINLSDYHEIDDKGLFVNNSWIFEDDCYKVFYGKKPSGDSIIHVNKKCYYTFEFILKNSEYEDVKERLSEIISEYYSLDTESKFEIESQTIYMGKDDYVSFKLGYLHCYNCGEAVGKVTFASTKATSVTAEDQLKINAIMKKLNDENLISEFYMPEQISKGQSYLVNDFGKTNFYRYITECIDVDAIQSYIDENNLNCTLQSGIDENDMPCHFLVANEEMEFEEYFNIVVNIYEDLDYKPIREGLGMPQYYYGTNALETISETQENACGDADGDNELTVRDCSFIALTIAQGRNSDLSDSADFNKDGEVNVRDAAAIAKSLAQLKS